MVAGRENGQIAVAHVGYARVSTLGQDPSLQADALAVAGCTKVFEDRASGARADRPGLQKAMDYTREGDVLIVWKLERARAIIGKGLTVREAATRLKVGKTALYEALRG
jgi:resolvase-like protein